MSGNLLNNSQIRELMKLGLISIAPFDEKRLKDAWYCLHPRRVWIDHETRYAEPDYGLADVNVKAYKLEPGEYVEVEVEEKISLGEGIVGEFIPASGAIEAGILLTMGKLDSGYTERIKFGVFNAKKRETFVFCKSPIGYVQFFDVRGEGIAPSAVSEYDKMIREVRASEDGRELVRMLGEFFKRMKGGE